MERANEGHFIFFLIDKNEGTPSWFYHFSLKFSQFQIKIIPVTLEQFLELTGQQNKSYLIVSTLNFRSKTTIEKTLNSFLGLAVKKKKVTLFHLSSFKEIPSLMTLKYKKDYSFYKMPIDMDFLTQDISRTFFAYQKQLEKWPGGKKFKLPNV